MSVLSCGWVLIWKKVKIVGKPTIFSGHGQIQPDWNQINVVHGPKIMVKTFVNLSECGKHFKHLTAAVNFYPCELEKVPESSAIWFLCKQSGIFAGLHENNGEKKVF